MATNCKPFSDWLFLILPPLNYTLPNASEARYFCRVLLASLLLPFILIGCERCTLKLEKGEAGNPPIPSELQVLHDTWALSQKHFSMNLVCVLVVFLFLKRWRVHVRGLIIELVSPLSPYPYLVMKDWSVEAPHIPNEITIGFFLTEKSSWSTSSLIFDRAVVFTSNTNTIPLSVLLVLSGSVGS